MNYSLEQLPEAATLHLFAMAASLVSLFSLPIISSYLLKRAKRAPLATQYKLWIVEELCLACSIFLAFTATGATVLVCSELISPFIWGRPASTVSLDQILTARDLFYWGTVTVFGWSVFNNVGLHIVRDVHKNAKESNDLLRRARPGRFQ